MSDKPYSRQRLNWILLHPDSSSWQAFRMASSIVGNDIDRARKLWRRAKYRRIYDASTN